MRGLFDTNMAIVFFSLSCVWTYAQTHSLEMCCISTWRERWCQHPVSRSSSLSVNFIDNDILPTNEWKKKEKFRFLSIQSNHDRISELFTFSRSSIILFWSFWLIDFYLISHSWVTQKKRRWKNSPLIVLSTVGQIQKKNAIHIVREKVNNINKRQIDCGISQHMLSR
jgi:hypothetical protein